MIPEFLPEREPSTAFSNHVISEAYHLPIPIPGMRGSPMKIFNAIAAAGLLLSSATIATSAQAQDRHDGYGQRDDRDHRGDRRDDRRDDRHWNNGRHNGWNNHRHCWNEWRHHHNVRICR
jgi:hypothetical protein